MRSLISPDIDKWRDRSAAVIARFGGIGDHTVGRFIIILPLSSGVPLTVIAAAGHGWDHVSVSAPGRCPTWHEMDAIKRLFFETNETAMQLHVPPAEHVNRHPYVLHLWRPHGAEIPRPPEWMV